MYNVQDNIVALATVPGRSALNVVRCSGPGALHLLSFLAQNKEKPKANYVYLRSLYNKKQIIDQAMIVFFKSPKSFTGQDMLEISTHGGGVIVKKLISVIVAHGFRHALPGEFSYRAFVCGKIDLVQAESISSLVDANNNLDTLYSLNNLRGSLSKEIKKISTELLNIIIYIEHELDFLEGEIDFREMEQYKKQIKKINKKAANILEQSYLINENKGNINVSIIGKTNVGKSSLFNLLLGSSRSIVTSQKGTTTDTVSARVIIDGADIELIDTAGIRKTKKEIEKEGIKRTYETIERSDIVLFVDDKNPKRESMKYSALLKNKKVLYVHNKTDLIKTKKHARGIHRVSCKRKTGIRKLLTLLSTETMSSRGAFLKQNMFTINERQKGALVEFIAESKKVVALVGEKKSLDIVASSLRQAYNGLSSILHKKNKDEIINNIFSGFCVGK